MLGLLVFAGFALPPLLLVTGLLLLGMAMPSARQTLARRGWLAPGCLALILASSVVLAFLIAWRGDSETSTWTDAGTDLRVLWAGALVLAAAGAAAQWWVMLRYDDGIASRVRSVAAGLAGTAMLALFAALGTAWVVGIG